MSREKFFTTKTLDPAKAPGKGENIPGDGRREMIGGVIYKIRAFDTFVRELDAFQMQRKESAKEEKIGKEESFDELEHMMADNLGKGEEE